MDPLKLAITEPGLDLSTIKPGSVLLVRYGQEIDSVQRGRVAQELQATLERAGLPKGVIILMAKPGDSIDSFNETQMNQAGWFRKSDVELGGMRDINGPKIVEVRTDKDHKTLWVNVDDKCVLRCSKIEDFKLIKHSAGPH